jgi:hypothetical protein
MAGDRFTDFLGVFLGLSTGQGDRADKAVRAPNRSIIDQRFMRRHSGDGPAFNIAGASPNEDGALLIFFLSPRRNE